MRIMKVRISMTILAMMVDMVTMIDDDHGHENDHDVDDDDDDHDTN